MVDYKKGTIDANIPVEKVYAVAVNEKTNKIYSNNSYDDNINVIDGSSNTITGTIQVGPPATPDNCFPFACTNLGYSVDAIAVDSKRDRLYAGLSNGPNGASVIAIDTGTGTPIAAPIQTGAASGDFIKINEKANRIYVLDATSSKLSVIDGKSLQLLGDPLVVGVAQPSFCHGIANTIAVIFDANFGGDSTKLQACQNINGWTPTELAVNSETGKVCVTEIKYSGIGTTLSATPGAVVVIGTDDNNHHQEHE